jgi:diapolycopene oxygenase
MNSIAPPPRGPALGGQARGGEALGGQALGGQAAPIGVVGGGLAGLAAACVLAARGRRVILFETNDWLGGKAAVLEEAGFRFDMGPTILTVPAVLRRIFAEAGVDMADRLDLRRIDPQWRCFFEDGSVLDLHEDVRRCRRPCRITRRAARAGIATSSR